MTIILFFIVLAALIFVHELGHFLVAKWAGIRVDEFGLGFPPKIFSVRYGETLYTLNLIPFGGFVKIFGENPLDVTENHQDSARSFPSKNRAWQTFVLLAGILGNIIFAWILISITFVIGSLSPVSSYEEKGAEDIGLFVTGIMPDSPAEKSGMKSGDKIISINNGDEILERPTSEEVQKIVENNALKSVSLEVLRGKDKKVLIEAIPVKGSASEPARLGFSMTLAGIVSLPIHKAFWEGSKSVYFVTKEVALSFFNLINEAVRGKASLAGFTGPVGIAGMVGEAGRMGLSFLLSFTAFISINLAVLNLVPFPALDGGRILIVAIEAVMRRPINGRLFATLNTAGFIILLGLMFLITYRDIVRIF